MDNPLFDKVDCAYPGSPPPVQGSVGYKNPPRRTQFKPGQSGNPGGRPKRRTSLAVVLTRQLDEVMELEKDGARLTLTAREAIARQLIIKASSGDARALGQIIDLLEPETRLPPETIEFEEVEGAVFRVHRYLVESAEAEGENAEKIKIP